MVEISKTAKASMGKRQTQVSLCPKCKGVLVATKFAKMSKGMYHKGETIQLQPKGMYWVCVACGHQFKI